MVAKYTLQGINMSHLGKRKIIFKYAIFGGYVSSLECSYSYKLKVILKMIGMMMMTRRMMMIVITRVIVTEYIYIPHSLSNIVGTMGHNMPSPIVFFHDHLCKEHLKAEDRLCLKRVKVRPVASVGCFGQGACLPRVDEVDILFV